MYKGRLWPRSWASAIISIIMKIVQCFECAKNQQHINCVRPVHKCYLEERSNSRLLALVLQIRGDWCLVSTDSFAKTAANTSSSQLRFIALLELGLMKPSTVMGAQETSISSPGVYRKICRHSREPFRIMDRVTCARARTSVHIYRRTRDE